MPVIVSVRILIDYTSPNFPLHPTMGDWESVRNHTREFHQFNVIFVGDDGFTIAQDTIFFFRQNVLSFHVTNPS